MKTRETIEENYLVKATSQMIADLVTGSCVTKEKIDSGLYAPISQIAELIDFAKVYARRETLPDTERSANPRADLSRDT